MAALAPLPPLPPPPTVGAVVGAVPHAAAVAPGTAPRAAAAVPTAEHLALAAAVVLFLIGDVFTAVCFMLAVVALERGEVEGVCHSAALVAPHVVYGLLWTRKLRLVGCRHIFLVSVPMALVCYEMLIGQFSHATTSLLEEEAAERQWWNSSDQRLKSAMQDLNSTMQDLNSGLFDAPLGP